jgi:3-deoxy-D-arabino-heptulosonate 7-phosphate (DAHP) synthase class II
MSETVLLSHEDRLDRARSIADDLPQSAYSVHYQPTYEDQTALLQAMANNMSIGGITTSAQAWAFRKSLESVSDQDDPTILILSGSCREPIVPDEQVENLASNAVKEINIVASSRVRYYIYAQRNRGQNIKPRSSSEDVDEAGNIVPPYMGDSVNSKDLADRQPDPKKMERAAVQAHKLEEAMTRRIGFHVPSAHEALHLAYELPFVVSDPLHSGEISLSADALWAGRRTNRLENNPILDLLSRLNNTVGVKIAANSTEEHIAGLVERLDPDHLPGKLIYMLRLSLSEADQYPSILKAIKEHAPGSIVMFDIHGMTEKRVEEKKIVKLRSVPRVLENMGLMALACKEAGVKFGGIHLETTVDPYRLECTDEFHTHPLHEGDLDPCTNPLQTVRILNGLADIVEEKYM